MQRKRLCLSPTFAIVFGNDFCACCRWHINDNILTIMCLEHVGVELWSEEERQARQALAARVTSMAEAEPQVAPDLTFYREMFTLLIK